ncbi:hypothetical protein CXF78_15585, partial [Shewanella sp. 11B5]|uniref:ATP-binding cassette domain-containing protein n=1 Tax=Shewanella sp. 11B5 TaxID=2058298 RepID=UPI000CC14AD8
MVKNRGFKIKTVKFGGNSFDLTQDNGSTDNIFTIILGKNGCGKSRLLKQISTNFAISDQFLRENPDNWLSICNVPSGKNTAESFLYSINDIEIKAETLHKELAGAFYSNVEVSDYKKCFPTELICVSTSPFDRFPDENRAPLNRSVKDHEVSYPSIYSY